MYKYIINHSHPEMLLATIHQLNLLQIASIYAWEKYEQWKVADWVRISAEVLLICSNRKPKDTYQADTVSMEEQIGKSVGVGCRL